MGVLDGQPVNQAITNPAFINKNIDDAMANKLSFVRPLSGPDIVDIQQAVNNLYTATGVSESQSGTNYNAASGTILNGDSYQLALTKLADKFDSVTGHLHTGAPGDGPLLNVVRSLAVSGNSSIFGDLILVSGNNIDITQSATGFRFDWVPVVTTTIAASGNPDLSGQVILVAGNNVMLSQTGQQITISASGGGGGGGGGSGASPSVTALTSLGSITGWLFTCSSANATVGDTYTNNGNTYTVLATISAGTQLFTSGVSAPLSSGTLTKASGSGDATITFSAEQGLATYTTPSPAPLYLKVRVIGGGGGGAGSGTTQPGGDNGTTSAFGANLIIANGGNFGSTPGGGSSGSAGGTASIATSATVLKIAAIEGGAGTAGQGLGTGQPYLSGGCGGSSALGGGGSGGLSATGLDAVSGSGSGGGGAGSISGSTSSGGGGGSGGYAESIILSPGASFVYTIGSGGVGGTAGSGGGFAGGNGASGIILVEEYYGSGSSSITDFSPYSLVIGATTTAPTLGTTSTNNARWRQVGDSMEIIYTVVQTGAGSSGSGNYLFPIPSPYTIDTTKIGSGTGGYQGVVGVATGSWTASGTRYSIHADVIVYDSTNLALQAEAQFDVTGNSLNNSDGLIQSASGFIGSGTTDGILTFTVRVPITGWTTGGGSSSGPEEIYLTGANGQGGSSSGETAINNFAAVTKNVGTAMTYVPQTTTTGDYILINTTGVYTINYVDTSAAGTSAYIGISLNSVNTSSSVITLAESGVGGDPFPNEVLAVSNTLPATQVPIAVSITLNLAANDIIRAHGVPGVTYGSTPPTAFRIVKIAGIIGSGGSTFTPIAPTVQKFLSGSGTYTTPTSPTPLYIKVTMVGGGGGGNGSGVGGGSGAMTATATTFGTSLLTANPGAAGAGTSTGGAGGTASLGSGPVGIALRGGSGSAGPFDSGSTTILTGGAGGDSAFGGGGGGSNSFSAGLAASLNSGGGGGGAGSTSGTASVTCGAGGGAGGFVCATITSPASTYAYTVGTGGDSTGTAGPTGRDGGSGAAGLILVEEFYQ